MVSDKQDKYLKSWAKVVQKLQHISCEKHENTTIIWQDGLSHPGLHNEVEAEAANDCPGIMM